MFTTTDERQGLVKTYWKNVRERIVKVEPEFSRIVDKLDPGEDFPLYLAYYPYGAQIGDHDGPLIPKLDGGQYYLSDPDVPKEIFKDLGYGKNDSPFAMYAFIKPHLTAQ